MATQLIEQTDTREADLWATEREKGFCPECGQPLKLTRPVHRASGHQTIEPWLLALVGLFLAFTYGVRVWHGQETLVSLDRQIAGERMAKMHDAYGYPSNQVMLQAEFLSNHLRDRRQTQRRIEHDSAGLGIGLIGLLAGAGLLVGRLSAGFRRRTHKGASGPSSCRTHPGRFLVALWGAGTAVTRSIYLVLLIVFVGCAGTRLIQGVPPTLGLADQALDHTVEIVVAVGGMLGRYQRMS